MMSKGERRSGLLFMVVLLGGQVEAGTAPAYIVEDLGVLHPGWQTLAEGINNAGVVVGVSENSGFSQYRAVRCEGGQMLDLGTLGGNHSEAFAINDAGQIVGDATVMADPLSYHAFRWTNGVMIDLGVLPGGNASQARAINSAGDVVGLALRQVGGTFAFHAFKWHDGVMTDLDSPSTFLTSYAEGINDAGVIVGTREPGGATAKALRWVNGVMKDLNTLLPPGSGVVLREAHALNESGLIVGEATFSGSQLPKQRAFIFNDGVVTDIGAPAGSDFTRAWAINEAGDVVGDIFFTFELPRAFLFRNGELIDLNTKISQENNYRLTNAFGINDLGQISCSGHDMDNFLPFHAFLLTPRAPADLNADGAIDGADLGLLLGAWGPCLPNEECLEDLDGDGTVGGADLGLLLGDWSETNSARAR